MGTFPTVINDAAHIPEWPARYGPYEFGGTLYVVNYEYVDDPLDPDFTRIAFVHVLASINGGETWVKVNEESAPQLYGQWSKFPPGDPVDPPYFQAVRAGNELYVFSLYAVYDEFNTQEPVGGFHVFDLAGNSWTGGLVEAPTGIVTVYRPLADDFVTVTTTDVEQVIVPDEVSLSHAIPFFQVFDKTGSVTASGPMGYEEYPTIIEWDQLPIGAAVDGEGRVHVFSAQATAIPYPQLTPFPFGDTDEHPGECRVPFDCMQILDLLGVGGGGGGDAQSGVGQGGGGGAGLFYQATYNTTPLELIPALVGAGGDGGVLQTEEPNYIAPTDGEDTVFSILVAGGGGRGNADNGGVGGIGDTSNGGSGGDGEPQGGGGGGGAGGRLGNGQSGATGISVMPGAEGGAGGSDWENPFGRGGNGGWGTGDDTEGEGGFTPGGGGGGGSGTIGNPDVSGGGHGAGGMLQGFYMPSVEPQPGRLWHQAILPNSTLGVLSEVEEGQFVCQLEMFQTIFATLDFNCAAHGGQVAIVFCGYGEDDYRVMRVGKAVAADSLSFTFQEVDSGNGGSRITPGMYLSFNALNGHLYMTYISAPLLDEVQFVYRADEGGGFGPETAFGEFDPGAGVYVAANYLPDAKILAGSFGTPTAYPLVSGCPGLDIQIDPKWPGYWSFFFYVVFVFVEGGDPIDIEVEFNGPIILATVTLGYTVNEFSQEILTIGDWDDVAAAMNGHAAFGQYGVVTGTSNTNVISYPPLVGGGTIGGGTPEE